MLRVFVSHLADHRDVAGQLKSALLRFGVSCFVAHDDIEPTAEWQDEIEAALKSCDALIALLHPAFHDSKWTDQEIGLALGRGAVAFAVRFGEIPYGFIGRFQAFNGNGKPVSSLARELYNAFRRHEQTRERMSEVMVALFENSRSYAHAKELIGHLEELEDWKPSYARRIRDAASSNSQISGSYGVEDRVERLARRWEQ